MKKTKAPRKPRGPNKTLEEKRAILRRFHARPEQQTIEDFCAKEGISQGSLHNYRNDKGLPSKVTVSRLSPPDYVTSPRGVRPGQLESLQLENEILRGVLEAVRTGQVTKLRQMVKEGWR